MNWIGSVEKENEAEENSKKVSVSYWKFSDVQPPKLLHQSTKLFNCQTF